MVRQRPRLLSRLALRISMSEPPTAAVGTAMVGIAAGICRRTTGALVAAIRERDEIIARVRAVEAGLVPMIAAMWAASRRVEELANPQVAE